MTRAGQGQRVDVAGSAGRPLVEVVNLAVVSRGGTSREGAALVAGIEHQPLGEGGDAFGPAEIYRGAVGVEHGQAVVSVPGHADDFAHGDAAAAGAAGAHAVGALRVEAQEGLVAPGPVAFVAAVRVEVAAERLGGLGDFVGPASRARSTSWSSAWARTPASTSAGSRSQNRRITAAWAVLIVPASDGADPCARRRAMSP